MKVYGQLESAAAENLATDPTVNVAGRFYLNTTSGKLIVDNGTVKRAALLNDGKAIIGTDATASNNVRLHHAGQSLLQFVTGDDTTAENTASTSLGMLGFRLSNLSAAPAVGNIGRLYYNTTSNTVSVDNGSAFLPFVLNPMTTAGDLIYGGTNGAPTRLAGGTNGQYLTYTGGVPSWSTISNSPLLSVASKTAAYTMTIADDVIFVSGGVFTVTLPDATNASARKVYRIKKTDASLTNIITLGTVSSQTIDGAAASLVTLNTQNETYDLISDGANWQILEHKFGTGLITGGINFTATTTNPGPGGGTGFTSKQDFQRISGKDAKVTLRYYQSTAGSAGSGDYILALPTGLTWDTNRVAYMTTLMGAPVQWGQYVASATLTSGSIGISNATALCLVVPYDATHYRVAQMQSSAGNLVMSFWSSGAFSLGNATLAATLDFVMPVAGWHE